MLTEPATILTLALPWVGTERVYTNARHTTYPCTRSCESEPAPCPDPGWAGGRAGGPLWPRCRARHSPACPAGEPWTTIGAPPPLHPCNRRHHHTTSIHARATYYTAPAHPRPSPSAPTHPSSLRWTHRSGKAEPPRDSEEAGRRERARARRGGRLGEALQQGHDTLWHARAATTHKALKTSVWVSNKAWDMEGISYSV